MADLSSIDKYFDRIVKGLPDDELDQMERAPASEAPSNPNVVLGAFNASMPTPAPSQAPVSTQAIQVQSEPVARAELGIVNPNRSSGYGDHAEQYRSNIEGAIRNQEDDLASYMRSSRMSSDRAARSRSAVDESVQRLNQAPAEYKEDATLQRSIDEARSKAFSQQESAPDRDLLSEAILSFGPAILGAMTGESGQIAQKAATKEARTMFEGRRKETLDKAQKAKESAMKVYETLNKIKQSNRESWDKEQQRMLNRAESIAKVNVDVFKTDMSQADKYLDAANNLSKDITKNTMSASKEYADLSNKSIDEANKEVRAKILAGQAQNKFDADRKDRVFDERLKELEFAERQRSNRADENYRDRKLNIDAAKARKQGEHLPLEEKKTVENLATKNANKISIKNQIDAVMGRWDSMSDDQKLAAGRQLLKTLNSTEGADAIGAEEANRLGSKLEFAYGNFTNSNTTQFGRDLDGFKQQAMETARNIGTAIDSNKAIVDSIMQGRGIPSMSAPPDEQTRVINGATYKKVQGGWQKVK